MVCCLCTLWKDTLVVPTQNDRLGIKASFAHATAAFLPVWVSVRKRAMQLLEIDMSVRLQVRVRFNVVPTPNLRQGPFLHRNEFKRLRQVSASPRRQAKMRTQYPLCSIDGRCFRTTYTRTLVYMQTLRWV